MSTDHWWEREPDWWESDVHWDDESDSSRIPDKQEAGRLFADMLLDLRWKGVLSARRLCVLAHYANLSGAQGPCASLAKAPGSPTGHYQRHLDRYLGTSDEDDRLYRMTIPAHDKFDVERTPMETYVVPPHETLEDEIAHNPLLPNMLRQTFDRRELPEAYYAHRVVRESAPGTVYPCVVYLDGVPFNKLDSLLGIVCYNVLTSVRHLACALRKSTLCKCGCRGGVRLAR